MNPYPIHWFRVTGFRRAIVPISAKNTGPARLIRITLATDVLASAKKNVAGAATLSSTVANNDRPDRGVKCRSGRSVVIGP